MLSIVVAMDRNRLIGCGNALPWRLPADLRHFKAVTMGKPIIMGRKTWESLPPRFRPLPGRRNVVISRQPAYAAPGAEVAGSLDTAIAACRDKAQVFIIGGAEIYRLAMPLADTLIITEVNASPDGDARFPPIEHADWQEASRTTIPCSTGETIAFVRWTRQ